MTRVAMGAYVALLFALALGRDAQATRAETSLSTQTPVGLTAQGRVLWNFEGLLLESFPRQRVVSAKRATPVTRRFLDFSCPGFCAPTSAYAWYRYVFTRPGPSAFHLSSRRFSSGYFGVQPLQILIRGRSVACNPQETRFLIAYPNTLPLTVACLSVP